MARHENGCVSTTNLKNEQILYNPGVQSSEILTDVITAKGDSKGCEDLCTFLYFLLNTYAKKCFHFILVYFV
jgi:hypothetical protein